MLEFQQAENPHQATVANALHCEERQRWEQAATFWQSIGFATAHATWMAKVARDAGNLEDAARWHRLAGQHTLAVQAERQARRARKTPQPVQRDLF